jgi:hypothetical protein
MLFRCVRSGSLPLLDEGIYEGIHGSEIILELLAGMLDLDIQ